MYGLLVLLFLYLPIFSTALASFSRKRYVSFPISEYTTKWYSKAFDSLTIAQLVETSFFVALAVTAICIIVGFFGALAYARYDWKGRRVFQKLLLLPIFFPQAVLGLALLLWFNFLGIIPSWKTAIVAHLVWVAPIGTLIMAIQAYSFDPSLEEAAQDRVPLAGKSFERLHCHCCCQVYCRVACSVFCFLGVIFHCLCLRPAPTVLCRNGYMPR